MIQIIVLLMIIYLFALGVLDINADECNDSRKNGKCCVNYFFNENNKTCDPCPLGTFGSYCSANCPRGYYGLFCNEKCNCKTGIHCSPTTGCDNASNHTTAINHTDIYGIPIPVIAVLCGISLLCIAVGVLYRYKSWKFGMNHRSKASGNNRDGTNGAVAITNANYTLERQPSSQPIHTLGVDSNDPMQAIMGTYNDIVLRDSDYVDLKRKTSDYRTLQLRIRNISCNSFDFDTMEKAYEECNLSSVYDKNVSETSRDMSNCYNVSSGHPVSDHFECNPQYEITIPKVQVHSGPENTYFNNVHVEPENPCYKHTKVSSCTSNLLLPPRARTDTELQPDYTNAGNNSRLTI